MGIHQLLHRLADSLPVILALEAREVPVVVPDLVIEPLLTPEQAEAHLVALEHEGWVKRSKDSDLWSLSSVGREWLQQSGHWYVRKGPMHYRAVRDLRLLHHVQQQSEHPAQQILRCLSSDWPVFLALEQLTHSTAFGMIHASQSPDGWSPQHLDHLVGAGLLAADRTPPEDNGPLYVIDNLGERWMMDPLLLSIRTATHFLG